MINDNNEIPITSHVVGPVWSVCLVQKEDAYGIGALLCSTFLNRCVWGVGTIEPSFSYASIDLHVYHSCAMNAMTAIERPCSGKHTVPRLKFTALLWAAFSKHSCACKGYENLQQCWFGLFSVLFLPTNCVHRQYRPIDVRVPKGDPFLVGDWCVIKGQSCKKNLKTRKQSIDLYRLCEVVWRNSFGSM